MFDLIDVPLVEDTIWTSRTVLNGLIRLDQLHKQQADPDAWVDYATWLSRERLARGLEHRQSIRHRAGELAERSDDDQAEAPLCCALYQATPAGQHRLGRLLAPIPPHHLPPPPRRQVLDRRATAATPDRHPDGRTLG